MVSEIYLDAISSGYIYKKEIQQCFDEEKQMFLADRYIIGECPKCSAKNQYGDGCEECGATYSATELINPISSLSETAPITKFSEHIFFDLEKAKNKLIGFLEKNLQFKNQSLLSYLNGLMEILKAGIYQEMRHILDLRYQMKQRNISMFGLMLLLDI